MFALPLLAAAPPQAAVLALAALAIYAAAALRLAEGQYADFYNLAFDFDPPRDVALDEYERGNVKHPLPWTR